MAGEFNSAWLKWGQAVVHAQRLDNEIAVEMAKFQSLQPYVTRREYSAKYHAVRLLIVSIEPIPDRLGLILGDVANNFRSSLDHLAWALVTTRPKRPLKKGESVYFPICRCEADFNSHSTTSQLLQDRDRKIVRRFQPFWNTPRYRPQAKRKIDNHCLSVLPDINRDDKHKAVRPLWLWPEGGILLYGEPRVGCEIRRPGGRAKGTMLQPGVEIGRIYVKKTEAGVNPDVYMHAQLTVEPTFDGRVNLSSWLTETTRQIHVLLRRFAEPPKELLALGIVPGAAPLNYQSSHTAFAAASET